LAEHQFNSLEEYQLNCKAINNDIDLLCKNIIQMGFSLKELFNNLTEKVKETEKKLLDAMSLDSLTNLKNRRALEVFANENKYDTLIFIDIDSFASINDYFGIEVGNVILKNIAKSLKSFAKHEGEILVYRLGSDEFAILGINSNPLEKLKQLLTKFSVEIKGVDFHVDFTYGISTGENASIVHSDIALNEAKNRQIKFLTFNNELYSKQDQEKNIAISQKIKDGIENDKFVLLYQPIFNAKKEIVKYEALIRLRDGDKLLSPFFFLEQSKKTKNYFDITKIVIKKSFDKFRNRDISFSINISVDDIVNPDINQYLKKQIQNFPKPENITLEILESEQIEEMDKILDFITLMRSLKVKIAIDDFGSGYSNFAYLLKIKPDYLKIDGSIIKNIASCKSSYAIAQSIVSLAKSSGFTIIAEFIYSDEVFQKGKELDFDLFQGFYLSEPLEKI
jgi:diguanylate cyclase (GGDEF)-like protein